jgi:hypothetical protein
MSAAHPAVTLDDGTRIVLRPSRAADEERMVRYFEALSPESRRLRFHQPLPIVKPWLVRPLVDVDQSNHVAWAAWSDCELVGEARYVRSRTDPSTAEVAFSVADSLRRRGIARLLVETLGVLARSDGIETFVSTVGHDNRGSAAFLNVLGTRFSFGDGALDGRGPVPPWTGSPELAARLRDAHRPRTPASVREIAA